MVVVRMCPGSRDVHTCIWWPYSWRSCQHHRPVNVTTVNCGADTLRPMLRKLRSVRRIVDIAAVVGMSSCSKHEPNGRNHVSPGFDR